MISLEYIVTDVPEDLARSALLVQDACNLSGVAHSLSRAVTRIWELARELGHGTDWVNQHPVVVLFVDKLASLARCQGIDSTSMDAYGRAYDLCKAAAEQQEERKAA